MPKISISQLIPILLRVMYAYAPITHDEEGIIGAIIISTSFQVLKIYYRVRVVC